jgi:hypothetical protein
VPPATAFGAGALGVDADKDEPAVRLDALNFAARAAANLFVGLLLCGVSAFATAVENDATTNRATTAVTTDFRVMPHLPRWQGT